MNGKMNLGYRWVLLKDGRLLIEGRTRTGYATHTTLMRGEDLEAAHEARMRWKEKQWREAGQLLKEARPEPAMEAL